MIKDQALIWLKKQGVQAPKLKDVSLHWLSGKLVIKGLLAQRQGFEKLKIDNLSIAIDYRSLFDNKLLIEKINLSGVEVSLVKRQDTMFLGPIDIRQFQGESTTEIQSVDAQPLLFGLKRLHISDLKFNLDIAPYRQKLSVDSANLYTLYQWQQQQQSRFDLDGKLNDSVLNISSTGTPLATQKKSQLQLKLKDFPLHSITQALMPQLVATLDIDLKVGIDLQSLSGKVSHSGGFRLSSIKWQDSAQQLNLDKIEWQGKGEIQLQKAQLTSASVDGGLQLQNVLVSDQNKPLLALAGLQWNGPLQAILDKRKIKQLNLSQNWSLSGLKLQQKNLSLNIKQLQSKAADTLLQYRLNADNQQQIKLSSNLNLQQLVLKLNKQQLHVEQLQLIQNKPLSLSLAQNSATRVIASPTLTLNGLMASAKNNTIKAKNLSIQGSVRLDQLSTKPVLSAAAKMHSKGLKIAINDALLVRSAALNLSAKAEDTPLANAKFSDINLSLQKLSVQSAAQSFTLFALQNFELTNANYSSAKIELQQLKIQQLSVAKNASDQALSKISLLKIENLALANQQQLKIDKVTIKGSSHSLNIDEKSEISPLVKLKNLLAKFAGSSGKKELEGKDRFYYAIKEIEVSGDNELEFEDKSVDPWFKSRLNLKQLNIQSLDNQSDKEIPIKLVATINDSANLAIDADYALFSADKNGQWEMAVSHLDLPVVSPYAGKFAGYFLDSGRLSLSSKGSIEKGIITGKNTLEIDQLGGRPAGSAATSTTDQSLSMPLELAISVMEDAERKINLSVPITGSVDDPDFGYASVLEIITKKGIKSTVFGLIGKALQPYGVVLSLVETAVEANKNGTFINLSPVEFAPGSARISTDMQSYLNSVAKMMNKRKKLKLKICATAVLQDKSIISPDIVKNNNQSLQPIDQTALEKEINNHVQVLASTRNEQVKQLLLKKKVNPQQLFTCFAKVSLKNTKQKPSVSLGF
ncbi:MAG: hypothetical protein OFPI_03990 [Osedax symbiont Rs2]|nr:MAG: hypothetical protein OFPI_03990 [Osedax symbiont Rs2]